MYKSKLRNWFSVLVIGGVIFGHAPVFAQGQDGSIRGNIIGADSGTTVEVVDSSRGITKSTSVSESGTFRVSNLAPGTYTVNVISASGVIDSKKVAVTLDGVSSVTLGATQMAVQEITILGKAGDGLVSSLGEIGLVISSEELSELPVARNLEAVTLLAPGVSKGDSSFVGTSFSGSSVAENTSFINGLNTTNFRNGLGFSIVPFEFYDTIQVKTGGYSAKYGRSTGGVQNARSKSGSNEFDFGVNMYFDKDLETSANTYSADNSMDEYSEKNYDVYASGALLKDRVFFYGLYSKEDYSNEYYGLTSGRGYKSERDGDFWGAKLDAYITDNHRLEMTAFSDERDTVEGAYTYDSATKETGDFLGNTFYRSGGDNWIITYTGDLTDSLQLKVSKGESNANRTTEPATANIPVVYQVTADDGFVPLGDWTSFSIEQGEDVRESLRADLTWDLGDHFIEIGIDNEDNVSTNATINSGGVYWLLHPTNDRSPYICDVVTECPSGQNARRRTYSSGGSFNVKSDAYYIQDTWMVNDQLTLELGLRNETFTNYNSDGLEFVTVKDQWAPRVSASLDMDGTGKHRVFGSYGQYYLPIASNTNIRLAGGETYIHDFYDWDGTQNSSDQTPTGLGPIYRTDTFGTGDVPDTRSLVDSGMQAMYQTELIAGYELVADNDVVYGVKAMYRNLETSIEDVAIDAAVITQYNANGNWDASKVDGQTVEEVFSGFHQYVLANPGEAMRVYIPEMEEWVELSAEELNYPEAKRQYAAIEATIERPFDGRWSLNASYVWAHSWGNNEGYVRSDNGQDDAGLTTNFDQPGLTDFGYGNLPNDRRHTIKVYGNYMFDNEIRVGANFLWQSGRPVGCFGVHPTDDFAAQYGEASFYCGGEPVPRGAYGTTGDYINLDLNAQYTYEIGDQELTLSFDLFNVLNSDSAVEINEVDNENLGRVSLYQEPMSYRLSARYNF